MTFSPSTSMYLELREPGSLPKERASPAPFTDRTRRFCDTNTLVTHWLHTGYTLVTPWLQFLHTGYTVFTPCLHPGYTLVPYWCHTGATLVTHWLHTGYTLVTHWRRLPTGDTLVTHWCRHWAGLRGQGSLVTKVNLHTKQGDWRDR